VPVLAWGGYSDWMPAPQYAAYLVPKLPILDNITIPEGAGVGGSHRSGVEAYLAALVWGMVHVSGIDFSIPMREPRAMQCCMIVTLLAISTNATLIGSVTTTLTRIQAYSNKEQRHREALSAWCVEHQVPLALQQRIHKYYDFAGGVSRQKDKLIPNLPKALAFQLDLFLKRTLFLRTPFFQGCAIKQIMALVPLVTSEHMMPGRIFARAGTSIEGLYLVARGRVLLIKGEQQVGVRFSGGFVGEQALIDRNYLCEYVCMAGDWSELLLLKSDDFRAVARQHPVLNNRINVYLQKDKGHNDMLQQQEHLMRLKEGAGRHGSVDFPDVGPTRLGPFGTLAENSASDARCAERSQGNGPERASSTMTRKSRLARRVGSVVAGMANVPARIGSIKRRADSAKVLQGAAKTPTPPPAPDTPLVC